MDSVDPLEERRRRLEQAEREARGDFSQSYAATRNNATGKQQSGASGSASSSSSSASKSDDSWRKARWNEDDDSPNAILNRQHNNLRAQAQATLNMAALLDVSTQQREENRGT